MNADPFRQGRKLPVLNVVTSRNIRKTIDLSQEYLETSRQKEQEKPLVKSLSPKPKLKPLFSPGKRIEIQKKELRVSQPMAPDRYVRNKLQEAMEEYGSLELFMKAEANQTLTNLLSDTSRKSVKERNLSQSKMASTGTMFHSKEYSADLSSSRQAVANSLPAGNFVFQKKKGSLRDSNQMEHIYQYALGTGIASIPPDSLGLNGKKANVREVLQKQLVRQQKRYLKDHKFGSIATFRSTNKDFGGTADKVKEMLMASSKRRLLQPSPDRGIDHFKSQIAVSLNKGHLDYSLKLNPKVLDGSYFEATSIESTGRTKGCLCKIV